MAKKNEYLEVGDLLKGLIADVEEVAGLELDKNIKKAYGKETKLMYKKYKPQRDRSRYRRNLDGSFADEVHFKSEVYGGHKSVQYILHNERRTDCRCKYCMEHLYPRIDDFIEEGIAGRNEYMKRPVSEDTEKRIEEEEIVEKTLERSLRRRGWGFE